MKGDKGDPGKDVSTQLLLVVEKKHWVAQKHCI